MEATNPKTKYPRKDAIAVARELVKALDPYCERLIVAGSLRRRKEMVGDVELLYVPKRVTVPVDMFLSTDVQAVDTKLEALILSGVLALRKNVNGSTMWGEHNKLAVHVASGIPVDLFSVQESGWFSYLVCRTGGAQNNIRIASAAKSKGWHWDPYRGLKDTEGNLVKTQSEEEIFALVGLPFLKPWQRD